MVGTVETYLVGAPARDTNTENRSMPEVQHWGGYERAAREKIIGYTGEAKARIFDRNVQAA